MLLTGTLVCLLILLVMLLVNRDAKRLIRDATVQRGIAIAQLFAATNLNHLKFYEFVSIQQNAQTARSENDLLYVIVYSKEGVTASNTADPAKVLSEDRSSGAIEAIRSPSPLVREILFGEESSESKTKVFDISVPVKASEPPSRWGTVRIGVSVKPMNRSLAAIRIQILRIGVIGLFFGLLGAMLLAQRIVAPISELIGGSMQAAKGDLSHRIEVHSGDELEGLAENFNYMMDQIKLNQEDRIKSEKMAAVGHMVNTIVHDCRTPITVIKGFASVLKDFDLPLEQKEKCLDFIDFEVGRMEKMLDEILQFARDQVSLMVLEDGHCDEFVRECSVEIDALLRNTDICLRRDLQCDLTIKMDRDKLRRAILNIAANAKDALKGHGEIKLVTRSTPSHAVIEVSDTGKGMPEEVRKKIFNQFFTHGKSGGFGLGMSITKNIIDGHSGKLSLESEVGKGTTFCIQIPISTTATKASAAHYA
jgi:signal transduction histidine kinase